MTGFDPELYLRLCAEDTLLSGEEGTWDDPLVEQARALVAVDAVSPEAAARVISEYVRAQTLRGQNLGMPRYRGPLLIGRDELSAVQALAPRRVARCGRVIEQPWGILHVKSVVLTPDETRLYVTMRTDTNAGVAPAMPARRGPHMRHGFASHHSPPSISVKDDRGTVVSTNFSSGEGSDTRFSGVYTADASLHRGTRWLEVSGERIDLVEDDLQVSVDVEPLDNGDLARRYLQHRLLVGDGHGREDLRSAIQALVASGALAPRSPVVDQTLRIEELKAQEFRGDRGDDLPQPWRSLCQRRHRRAGPVGSLYFGAVTPVFDGVSVALNGLRSGKDAFQVQVEAAGAATSHPFSFELGEPSLAFTASDDRGDHYLGHLSSHTSSDRHLAGDLEFTPPALNAQATQLDITVSTGRLRAVFHVPLRWSAT